MTKKIKVPNGKQLTALAGGYVFTGPCEVSLSDKFIFDSVYDDGTPLQYTGEKGSKRGKKSDTRPANAPHSISGSESGSGNKAARQDSEKSNSPAPVQPNQGTDNRA